MKRRALALLAPEVPSLAAAFACMLVLAATTALAAELVGPVLHALVLGGPPPRWAARFLFTARASRALLPALLVAVGLVKGAAYLGQFLLLGMAGARVGSRLREELLRALVAAGPAFLSRRQTGDLLSRLSSDVTAIEMAVTYALAAYVRDGLTAAALLAVCLTLDWRLAAVAFGLLPLTVGPIARIARELLRGARRAQAGQGAMGQLLAEGLQGLPLVQVDGLAGRERERFREKSRETLAHLERNARLQAAGAPIMEVVAVAGLALMLWMASGQVARGTISADHLVSFLAAALLLAQPLKSLGKVGHFAVTGLAAAERIFEAIDGARAHAEEPGPATPRRELREEIELRDVWFRYPTRSGGEAPWVLAGLSLRLPRGERLGLVGESGSGKSTVASLLLGLWRPERGALLADGADLASSPASARRGLLAWMGQEPLLLDLTVGENIAIGEREPDPARLREAAARAGALAPIERAGGFLAPVGERGRAFSGGERQRICLARTFYRDAPVLILDEPTSQLDARAEDELSRAIEPLLSGRTALVITHRLATLRGCDRVVVLAGGRVVEEGPPEALLAGGGRFAALMAGQRKTARAAG